MTEAETTAAEAARQTNLRGIKGEIQGGRPGQRREGSVVHEATSNGKDESQDTGSTFWRVPAKKHVEWDPYHDAKPGFRSRQHKEQATAREAQAAEARAIHLQQTQMRLSRFRSQIEALSPEKLREKLTSSYAKMMFAWPPSQEVRSEFLLASAEWSTREVLVEAMTLEIQKLETELQLG